MRANLKTSRRPSQPPELVILEEGLGRSADNVKRPSSALEHTANQTQASTPLLSIVDLRSTLPVNGEHKKSVADH